MKTGITPTIFQYTEILNIVLILLSLALAIVLPFELFLFSYIVLGPLHYLTELYWLRERNFFLPNPRRIIWLIVFAVCVSVPFLYFLTGSIPSSTGSFSAMLANFIGSNNGTLIVFVFVLAAGLVYSNKNSTILLFLIGSMLAIYAITHVIPAFILAAGLMIPTLLHVYLFTLIFVISGWKKDKNRLKLFSAVLVILVPVMIIYIPLTFGNYQVSDSVQRIFLESNFQQLHFFMSSILHLERMTPANYQICLFKIQVFVAFCYTYHYLNWFAKTSVIGWAKKLNTTSGLVLLIGWLLAIAVYAYDTRTGFATLFLLSILHVFCEFPLNFIAIQSLFARSYEARN